MKSKIKIFLSIDLEEWWGVESFKGFIRPEPSCYDDRMGHQVHFLLNLLSLDNISCHFFILGRVAARYPDLIKEICIAGHDIGTHGHEHELIYRQTKRDFEYDLKKSIDTIESIIQKRVVSFRAPSYSITRESLWSIPILVKNGILYDSSIVPTRNKRFGIGSASKEPYKIQIEDSGHLFELPPNTIQAANFSLPLSSGFAFRLFPSWLIQMCFRYFTDKTNIQPQIILHGWELDFDHPRLNVPFKSRLIHYYNLGGVNRKLARFIKNASFIKISEVNYNKEISFSLI
jgi:polysaccharide deacetylase family protein (PEP-CTERM system associated)